MEPHNLKRQNLDNQNPIHIKDTDMAFYIARKSEKLASAVYRITEVLNREEPIKWLLRDRSLNCMINCLSFSRSNLILRHDLYKTLILLIDEITTLLEVSFTNSLVSQMNFSILNDEFKSLKRNLEDYKDKNLKPIDLGVPLLEEKQKSIEEKDITSSQKEIFKIEEKGAAYPKAYEENIFKGHYKRQETRELPSIHKNKALIQGEKAKRRELILEYIKKHGEVNIKDIFSITELSNSYSEKTIQRELIDMVERGVLKKKGERRWSKYYL